MSLDVNLYGSRVGTLRAGTGSDFGFRYLPAVVEEAGTGTIVLSESLPVQEDEFDPIRTRTYFEGLLPEGGRREEIARRLRVSPNDGYGLLSVLGRDCAGAVSILPEEEDLAAGGSVEWLDSDHLESLVEELPKRPLGIYAGAGKLRLSLAGVQRKLALVREDGKFGLPEGDTASTVLVKPQYDDEYPDLAANEMFCMSVARAVGIPAAATELTTIGGRTCLLSRRFDRTAGEDQPIRRVHQEDLCQALGIPTNLKYQSDSGPGLPEFRRLLQRIGRGADVVTMVRAAALNFTLGNSDAHGKNFAILFADGGRRLAPLYDIVSTAVYDLQDEMAMSIGETFSPNEVELEDWLDMSFDCDLPPRRCFELVRETSLEVLARAEEQLERSRAEHWHAPVLHEIVAVATKRSKRVAEEIDPR